MNEHMKKALFECLRVIITALLAVVGINTSGCLALGDGASVTCTAPFSSPSNNK